MPNIVDKRTKNPPEHGSVLLTRFSPQVGMPFGDKSISPFSIKVEAFLRMADIPYITSNQSFKAISRNTKRKLPTIVTDQGDLVADSTFIIDHLIRTEPYESKCQARICDASLDRGQSALGHCLKVMCEESLYFIIGYWRYVYDPGFARYCVINPTINELGLGWLKKPAELYARRAIVRQLWAQGTGRHTQSEIVSMGQACLESIENLLLSVNEKFLFGPTPSTFDATLFAFLSAILEIDLDCPLKQSAQSRPRLVRYVQNANHYCGWPDKRGEPS